MYEFGLILDLRVLNASCYECGHLEVGLEDDLADDIVYAVELLRLVANGAASRQGKVFKVSKWIVARVPSLHDYYFKESF